MNCTACGSSVLVNSEYCQNCGTLMNIDPNPKFSRPPQEYTGPKKLFRSRKNRMIAGVSGGIGEYYDIDPNIIRLLFVVSLFMGGVGVLVYLVAIVLIPESPYDPWVEPK